MPAIITTPPLSATGPNCKMTFSYRQPVSLFGVFLNVFLHRTSDSFEKTISVITQPYLQWTTLSVQIGSLEAGYQIRIAGKGRPNVNTIPFADMEIDNIAFVNCSKIMTYVSDLNCAFENGFCGWDDVDRGTNSRLDWVNTL